jgi:hypothetical protein
MKQSSIILAAFLCLFILAQTVYAIPISSNDLWDISQGSQVTAHSTVHHHTGLMGMFGWSSDIRNMFGGYYGQSSFGGWGPHYETYFDQDCVAGTIHWVQWQTPSIITLRSFNLVAMHAPPPQDIRHAGLGFSQFRLQWSDTAGGPWTTLYELTDSDPDGDLYYGGGPTYSEANYLELAVNVAPTTAQYWRAEFVQYADSGYYDSGVRINELDGYDTFLFKAVDIDIYPNRTPNRVFLSRNYTLYVAVLGGADFDVTTLNSSTVKFGKTGTEASPMRPPMIRDLNGDGKPDAMYGFRTFDCNFALGDMQGWLKGSTASGTPVEGSDSVLVLP